MNTIPSHIFRGYDLRGEVDKDLDVENVEIIGKAYATWLLQRRIYDCVVGMDCRLSGPAYKEAIVKGLTNSGITVFDIGMTLSQISYFAQYVFRSRGLVMITASHNPKEYNGFKFGTGFSETMLTEDIVAFRDLAQSGKFISTGKIGEHIQKDVFPEYIEDLIRHVPKDTVKPFKLVVDACGATAGAFLPQILRSYGCEVIEQNTTPDGNFPVGTPDPTEREVQLRLAERVKAEGAELGVSYDCDGDRLGVVDEEGNLIWNDTLASLYAQDILEFLPGSKIIFNTLCSKQVAETVRQAGGVPIIWMTGHSFIKAKVREENAPFGGELSGHFYFVDNFYGHDDGAVASLRLLAFLTRRKQSLKEAIAGLPKYVSSPEIKVGCPDAIKFELVSSKIGGEIKRLYPEADYVEIDGVRMDTADEMLIIRASQNGPYLTIKFEAQTQEKYEELKTQVGTILHQFEEIDFTSGVNTDSLQ